MPAFLDDDALRVEIAPHLTRAAFLRAVTALEPYGFPKPDAIFKGRYWPAVRAWLDGQAGLREPVPPVAADGAETWGDEIEISHARFKAPSAKGRHSLLLGRGGAFAEGRGAIPGPLDPFTERRHARGD